MNKFCWVILLFAGCTQCVSAADGIVPGKIRGLRAFGGDNETHLPVVLLSANRSISGGAYSSSGDAYVTVEFDYQGFIEPQLKVIAVHCSRDWHEDWNHFDENFMHLQTTDVHGNAAPPRIRGYGYHYALRCPDASRRLTLDYSGNYKFKIIEGSDTLGEARFFAVDPLATITTVIYNDVDNSAQYHPLVHTVEFNAAFAPDVFSTQLEGMDCIIDHRMNDVRRIDPGDTSSGSRVDDAGPLMRFTMYNDVPGNAYRTLDLSDPGVFPPSSTPVSIVPRDILRAGSSSSPDMHGSSIVNRVPPEYADYIPIRFRLDAMGKREQDIFLVGPFNTWHPDIAYQMDYDAREHSYVAVVMLKRGIHEYQYVTGTWDAQLRKVLHPNWFLLEGNAWATSRLYTSLVYYRDTRYGGFDRIVGCGQSL